MDVCIEIKIQMNELAGEQLANHLKKLADKVRDKSWGDLIYTKQPISTNDGMLVGTITFTD